MDQNLANEKITSFRDLAAWKKARSLVKDVYQATRTFPRDETYGLTNQIRRAAVSVPSNIAEGYGRGALNDYIRFLQMARGSLFELQTQLLLAGDLDYLDEDKVEGLTSQTEEVRRILQGLIASLVKLRD
jgi:four helix bundle protein